ncbi:hypothetical protein V9T40_013429 [Parthenolecanium corni]|uniref:DUF5641 domain-containing protein n=1 Tax=Parthenolecanium corni TaxID=536013 RepID=A0AAN9T493_9HEMI
MRIRIESGYRQLLWTIWTEQYLLALRESKNIVSSRRATLKQPLEGDVVLMVDPSLRRGFWRTAIIDRLIRSGDGQKPRRNDGSTMSTTSPSSGCFSVALLLLTIFLDSLRASKYCSVQINAAIAKRDRRTYRNVPDRPYGQTQQTYTNRVRERAGFNMRDSTAGSAARLVVRRRRKSISSGVYRAAFFEASSRCTVTSACRSFPLVTGERAASGRARSSFADARRRYFSCRAAVSAGSFPRAPRWSRRRPDPTSLEGSTLEHASERASGNPGHAGNRTSSAITAFVARALVVRRVSPSLELPVAERRAGDANKVASFERFAIVDVNAFAVYRHAVECDERTPPNPREYPYSPGVSATYVSKTKVERNLCRGRKQPRSAYALSRSSTAAGDDDIFTHLALARTPLSRRADERRAIYPADRSGRGRRSTANVVRVFGVAARSLRRCATYPPALVSSSSSSDARECMSSGSGRAYSASYRCERRRADTFARSVARTYPATRTRSDERTVSRKSTSLPGIARSPVVALRGGGLEGALSAARRSTERRPVADRVSHESTSVLWLILPVVICLSQRLSHACLNRTHVTWITVVILELIHADRAPTSASSFGGSPVVVGRSEGALLLDQNRPSVSTALRARVERGYAPSSSAAFARRERRPRRARRARPVVPSLASRARHFGNATAVKILSAPSSRHRFGVARATSVPPSTPSRRVKSPSRRFRARVAGRGPAFASSPPATAFGRTSVTGGGYATSFSVNPGRWSVFGTGGNDRQRQAWAFVRDVRGEILGSSRDEPKRKHLPSMFSSDQERKLEVRRRSDTALVLTVNDAS